MVEKFSWDARAIRLGLASVLAALSVHAAPRLLLNEVMSADNAAFADEDGAYEDWIELLNAGDADAPLEGWGLTDNPAQPFKWTFPAGTLPPGGHLLVWASDKDRRPPDAFPPTPLPLVAADSVWRYRDDGLAPAADWAAPAYADTAWAAGEAMLGYGASEVKTTLGYGPLAASKYPAAYFRLAFESPVGAAETHGPGLLRLWADDGAILYLNGTEVLRVRMPSGPVTHLTYATQVVNNRGAWENFEIPLDALRAGVNVLAAEIHQVNAASTDLCFWLELAAQPSQLHANFKISAGNETVTLTAPDGTTADTAPALSVMRDASFGRTAGDAGGAWLMFPVPTPGAANPAAGYSGLLNPPTFSAPPGFYAAPVTVALAHDDPAAQLYYTLDGSTPTNAVTARCFLYTAPLTFSDRSALPDRLSLIRTNPPEMASHTQYGWMAPLSPGPKVNVLRAAAFRSGFISPRGAAGTWLVGAVPTQHTLRVVSLQTDEAHFFSDATGLFVPGDVYNTLGWNGHSVGQPNANYFLQGAAWERPVTVQLFETDRSLAFSQLMGARVHGGWSRAAAQKTLRLYARGEYGDSKVGYPLFPGQADTAYKRFLLRNSGNDWSSTGLRDAVMQQMFRPLARTDTQDYAPAVVYVNGEYWGVQNIREHYSGYLLERKYGVDPENVDLLKATVSSEAMEIDEGDDLDYKAVLAYIKANDLTLAGPYAWVEQHMDLDNLIDHYACEIYCCNTDWPGNNLGLWRVRAPYTPNAPYGHDGRWRWLMYDTDHGFGLSSSVNTDMMAQARRSSRGVCQPQFNRLLANPDFRNRFINRFADLLNTAFVPARVYGIIDDAAARVETEMPRHIARWGRMGSFAAWQSRIAGLKTFAAQRPAYALANIVNEFGLGGTAWLTVDITNGAGRVTVNTVTLGAATPGLANAAAPYPWSGVYFRSVPVTLTAAPELGFTFSHWETASGNVADPALVLTLTADTACRAVFEPTVLPRVTVNEVMADATLAGGFLHPETGAASDWFELLNEGSATVNLGGYWLEDDDPAHACPIPGGVTLAPGACLLVWTGADLQPGVNADGSVNASFGLGKNGDAVALLAPDRSLELDRAVFGAQSANVSQGRWGNGAGGAWTAFARPTPGLPNRNPAASANVLPHYPAQTVAAGETLALGFAPTAPGLAGGTFSVVQGAPGAAVDAAGQFTWPVPADEASGVTEFRVAWLGLIDGQAATDETTLLVAVSNAGHFRIDTSAEPAEGGTVNGGGVYAADATATLSVEAAPLWRFVRWSDGATAPTRQVQVRRDAAYTAQFAYGLDRPENLNGTLESGQPLLYWRAVDGAEGYVVRRAASRAGPFTEVGSPAANVFRDPSPPAGVTAYYTVAARHSGTESETAGPVQALASGAPLKLTGTVIGTLGSYNNLSDRTRDKAFDGDLATFYDSAADGGWTGLDLGSERCRSLASLRYAPRETFPGRMVNGRFEVSCVSDGTDAFESPVLLHTITAQPPVNRYTDVTLGQDVPFRYLRYQSPASGGWGNIAELEVYGCDAVPPVPAGSAAEADGPGQVAFAWSAVSPCNGYLVRRAAAAGGPYETIAYTENTAFLDTGLADGATLHYRVAAANGSSVSADSERQSVTTDPPPVPPRFVADAAGGTAVARHGDTVTMRLSGALDPRLELVCSDTLEVPVAVWPPVGGAAFSDAGDGSGAVVVSVVTNAPRLFFSVRGRARP